MKKFVKENYKIFISSLIYGLISYNLYFQAHYVHDSYRIYNFGFLQNLYGFWTQGRPMCMWFYMLCNFLNISPRIGQIISVFLVILFLSLCVTIVYILITKRIKKCDTNSNKLKFIIFVISNFLFFNVYITDWMLFFEACIFALGCLLSVIGAYFIIQFRGILKRYIISSILFIIGIFCYQASIAISGAIVVLFTIYDNKDKKIILIIKNIIINMIPYIIALLTNFIFIKLINLNNISDARLNGHIDIFYNILFPIKQFKWYFIEMFGYPTKYTISLLIFITFIFYTYKTFKNKKNKLNILFIIFSVFTLWFLSILPIIAMPSNSIYFISRNIPYIASIFPFMLLAIYLFSNTSFTKNINSYFIFSLIYTFIITISLSKVTSECLKNNTQDICIAKTIQNEIDNYERSTNNTIDTIILLPDRKLSLSEKNIKYYSDNTVRAFSTYYGAKEIMYFANKRIYNVSESTLDEKEKIFGSKEWETFDLDQIKFDKNILYLVKY